MSEALLTALRDQGGLWSAGPFREAAIAPRRLLSDVAFKEDTFAARLRGRGTDPVWNSSSVANFADKLAFKAYAAAKGVDTARTLQVFSGWSEWEALRPASLPSDCVLKDAGGSGRTLVIMGRYIVSAKSTPMLKGMNIDRDWGKIRAASLLSWAHTRVGATQRGEPWYGHIRPRFFTEELLTPIPADYKLYITRGVVRSIMVVTGRIGPGPARHVPRAITR